MLGGEFCYIWILDWENEFMLISVWVGFEIILGCLEWYMGKIVFFCFFCLDIVSKVV